jgi:membrane protease YdiL (CAAX protease family)
MRVSAARASTSVAVAASSRRRRARRARSSAGGRRAATARDGRDGDDGASAMTSSETMMHLDALLGVEDEVEETTTRTTVDGVSSSSSSSSVAEALTEKAKTTTTPSALWTLEDVVDRPDPLATHDPERDWLGAGPRWDVKWGAARFVLTMLAVDASFYVAGFFAPVYTYVGTRAEELIPDDPVLLQADLQRAYDDPVIFSQIFLNAEVTQILLGLLILGLSVGPFAPLPTGWFNDVFSSDDPKRNATGRESQQWKRDAVKRAQTERAEASGREAVRAIAGTFLGVTLVTWALYVAGVRGGENSGSSSVEIIDKAFSAGPQGIVNLIVTTVVLAPAFEEVVFRGYMLPSLTKFMPTPAAVGVSAVIFALIHEHGVGDTVQLIAVGLATGIVYARTRNLGASIAVHATFNAAVIALFALWVS